MEVILKSKVEKTDDGFTLIYHVTDERITLGWKKIIQGMFFGDYITLDSEDEYDLAREIVIEHGREFEKRLLTEPGKLQKSIRAWREAFRQLPDQNLEGPYFTNKGKRYYIKRGDEI